MTLEYVESLDVCFMYLYFQELQEQREKYKLQARELKEAVNKQKLAMEQYTDIHDQ